MEKIKKIISDVVSNKVATGIAVAVVRKNSDPVFIVSGREEEKRGNEITKDTLFDIASLTKVVFTAPLVMRFVEKGYLSLRDSLSEYLNGFPEDITILSLLTHTSGIVAWLPLFDKECKGTPEKLDSVPKITLETAVERIKRCGIIRKPFEKVEYSCMNYILLGAVLEKISGKSLKELSEEFFRSLGMQSTGFNPEKGKQVAATEGLKGVVHDENARSLSGISTNAGIFSSASDLALFSEMMLGEGALRNGERVLSQFSVRLMREVKTGNLSPRRTVGWIYGKDFNGAPDFAPDDSIGHSGFTGTSMFLDFKNGIGIIILTNRVYYGRNNKKHIRLRRVLSNAIYAEVFR